ncbi:hypothetical protein DEO72_LG3g652 [Vigna unguiculata]|uniref:Uncharacterized protein n=1 Tax=Vigna unguiculata TaxID=3917 RepID=A0A4D6LC24_VIGUN|nr:hypothetical protein DEO72_LG3g652 [Vigna unguiculata]
MSILVLFSGISSCTQTCVRKLDSMQTIGVAPSCTDGGSGSALALGGERVPPGGLDQFRLATLGVTPSKNLTDYDFSPFLFVYGDDRVIRYTGADVDTDDAEDAQATK